MKRKLRYLTDTQLQRRARTALARNKSITVYTMVDGAERRRLANPFGAMMASMNNFAAAAEKIGFTFSEALKKLGNPR